MGGFPAQPRGGSWGKSAAVNKGVGVENMHSLGDGLWHFNAKELTLK